MTSWITSDEFDVLSASTQRSYSHYLKALKPLLDKPIMELRGPQFMPVFNGLGKRHASKRLLRVIVGRIFGYAGSMGWVDFKPFIPLKFPRSEGGGPWPAEELVKAIYSCINEPVGRAMMLSYHTAMRVGDVLKLTWDQYDGESISYTQTKTKKKVRVPCDRELKSWLDRQDKSHRYIVTNAHKTMTYARFNYEFRKKFPIEEGYLNFHSIRHAAATRIAESGASPFVVMAVTGHSSISSAQRYTDKARMWEESRKVMGDL